MPARRGGAADPERPMPSSGTSGRPRLRHHGAAAARRRASTSRCPTARRQDAPIYVPPTRLRIVGTATFPAVGFASTVSDHTSMGTGALLAFQVCPSRFVAALNGGSRIPARWAEPGPRPAQARRPDRGRTGQPPAHRTRRRTGPLRRLPGGPPATLVVVQGVQRPAEIANYKTIGLTPALAGLGPRPRGHRGPCPHAPRIGAATPA